MHAVHETTVEVLEGTVMAESGIPWRRDAEKALEEAKQGQNRALVDFTAAPM
jgi:hypothetical protein